MAKKDIEVIIPRINLKLIKIDLIGTSPLITHKWSEKVKLDLLNKHRGNDTKVKKKNNRNPAEEFINSMYWLEGKPEEMTMEAFYNALPNAKFGFPTIAFKMAAASGGYRSKITKDRVSMLAKFRVLDEYAIIEGVPDIREDMVTVGNGAADLRYRGEFKSWKTTLTVQYNEDAVSASELINLFNYGGFACGVGEWRVEKEGQFGMFEVILDTKDSNP